MNPAKKLLKSTRCIAWAISTVLITGVLVSANVLATQTFNTELASITS